ncbi:remodeling and spacing factor 1-like isoform X2 [Mercenaria mercenaria]|uniref:remodeling and spacing factor 1-like isoform X2 n=1 Tax=Mercenaria mercenaria TaxID=6596 RepID=UPI00234F53BC|nr:remodeling and spacing factor 1-like isoform X2 [Mercenaria mercenaria]
MASQAENDCLSNPNFAVICSFMDRYAEFLGLTEIGYKDLQEWIEDTKNVSPLLIDLHVRLLRRIHKKLSNVTADRWERGVVKFCYKYSNVDAWEIERFGYKLAKISTKLTLLKNLMESQFDCNNKFKDKVNEIAIDEMRFQPIGRDKDGMAYWYFLDKELNLRVYREHQDDVDSESWELVCRSRDDLAKLVTGLNSGADIKLDKQDSSDLSEPVSDFNEDSRDSFKQKTPLGPSPLTVKQEPGEGDTAETKQPILLKISKSDIHSPSKMLKDKFVKEKGSEIQRIMCKMKEEGLIDSENDDDVMRVKEKNEKSDEVDGSVDSKDDQCNQTEGKNSDKDKFKCETLKKDGETEDVLNEFDNKKDVKKEIPDDKENNEEIKCSKEDSKETEISDTVTQESDLIENEVTEGEPQVRSKIAREYISEEEHINTDQDKRDSENESQNTEDVDEKNASSANVMKSSGSDAEKDNETSENKSLRKSESAIENKNSEQMSEKSKENDQKTGKSVEACELETEKDKIELPPTCKLSETENLNSSSELAMDLKSGSHSIKNDTVEINEKVLKECENLDEGAPQLSDDKSDIDKASELHTAEKLVEENNDRSVISGKEVKAEECDKAEKTAEISCEAKENESETCGANSIEEVTTESVYTKTQPNEMEVSSEQNNLENSSDKNKCSDKVVNEESEKLGVQSVGNVEQDTENQSSEKDSEIISPENCNEIQSHKNDTEIKSTEIISGAKDTDKISPEKDTGIKVPEEGPEIKSSKNGTSVKGTEDKSLVKDTESKLSEEGPETSSLEKDTDVKKARKRKKDEMKTEKGSSSTEEEIDNESKQPCKRPVKSAVRKSPKKQAEKEDANQTKIGEDEEENKITVEKSEGDKDEIKSDRIVNEVSETICEVEGKNKEEKGQKAVDESEKDTSEFEEKAESENELVNKSQRKVKGLVAHSRRSKSKAQKRQAENSDDMEPAEPASKRSKLRGRVSSRGRGKRRGVNFDSSSSDDDVPLSQVAGRGRGSNSRGKAAKAVGKQQKEVVEDPPKKKKVEVEEKKFNNTAVPEIPSDLSEEDTGRRRSARVRNMRARKKSPSPDYIPSELEESDDDFFDDDDDEFKLKSKKRKKKEPKEVIEEVPKGRNALRHEAKANKKGTKVVEEEEEQAACVKCLRSHQPEWILLCDKCDAGYHTACLRPPLMIIPDGDWFCPPCEHTSLKEKLEENLKMLDQAILKNDRLVRRKERLAFVSVSLDNVLKEPEPGEVKKERSRKKPKYRGSEDESGSSTSSETGSSGSTSESESSSEVERSHHSKKSKPKFIQRACRTKKSVSYRFEEFDELIMDAIEEDLSIPKEPKPRKIKPPGISRGKDMSNILGASDEEAPKKPVRKRKPRLTELDEDIDDDDDTDDYQLSDASNGSDATKSSVYESEEVSEDSIESSWRYNSRSTRKSRRKGGRNRKYKDDFVVDSDFESDEDSTRRSKRRPRRGKVNYREINSDETEVEDNDDSFHSSELSDSDFEAKRKKRNERNKKVDSKERPRSGKRQRIRKVLSSSESSEDGSDDSTPRKKKGKKPPSKSARYDSDETDESLEKVKMKKSKSKKFQELSDMSETEAEETEESDSSETEVSESDTNKTNRKKKNVKNVLKSDSEEEEEDKEKTDEKKNVLSESHDTHSSKESEESGWEEIGVDSDDENVTGSKRKDMVDKRSETAEKKGNQQKAKTVGPSKLPKNVTKEQLEDTEEEEKMESADAKAGSLNIEINKSDEQRMESDATGTKEENEKIADNEKGYSTPEVTPQKKKRGRKSKSEKAAEDSSTTPEVTPKKRGRKPKAKPEASETSVDETPIKKKRGRKAKSEIEAESEHVDDKVVTDNSVIVENKTGSVSEVKVEGSENNEESHKSEEQTADEKNETEVSQTIEKGKDDSPLSARNKQNAPVGVVKPEVRQGVIVENKQVIDGRLNESRAGENVVNPLQGMRDLAMGNQNIQGSHQSSFTPYSQPNYQGQNMPGYMGQSGFQGYPHQAPPFSQGGPGSTHPYQSPQGMPSGAPPQYPPNQGPMSPNSYQQHGPYMGSMPQGPPGYFPGNYRHPMGHPEGFGHSNPHGPNPQYYHPNQGPYQGQRHGYPEHAGPYHMGSQGPMPHPPNQQGPGPFPGMPYNYPNVPQQGLHRPGFGPAGPPQNISPNQPVRPQTRHAGPPITLQGSTPNPRTETEVPNRGFMMDNILKPNSEGVSNDVEDSAEVSDIDRYTSFLCKTE